MKSIYWIWVVIAADASIFFDALPLSHSTLAFVEVLLMHACACAVLAQSAYFVLPQRYRHGRIWSWLLLFEFAFIAPVVGPIGILLIIYTTLNHDAARLGFATPRIITLPEYDVQSKEVERTGQGAIRSRLTAKVPSGIRMQSLLTLQVVPSRVANPILENLLGDATDDVRLVAFGMLDAAEKKLSVQIHREQKNLERLLSSSARYSCLRHLAELHWELIVAALVHGEMRKHVLHEARQSLEDAMAMDESHDSGMFFLRGKILLAQGEVDASAVALAEAMRMGQPEASVLPYLAELAFQQRDFDLVRDYTQRLALMHVAPRVNAIVDLWTGRDIFYQYRDLRILQHI